MTADPWETHAGWWQDGFTDGADPEYEEQILPLAEAHLAGAPPVLDVGTGEGQVARLAADRGADGGRRRPHAGPDREAPPSGRAGRLRPVAAPSACPSPTAPSTRSSPAWCSSTSLRPDAAIARGGPGPRAGRPLPLLPQPPAAADPGQRLDRRPGPRPARAVLADRALPGRGRRVEEVEKGVFIPFVHRPLSPLRQRSWPTPACPGAAWRSRPRRPGFLARAPEYQQARHHPPAACSLAGRTPREGASGEFVVITGLSGAGRSSAADDLEDLGWFVIDNLPPP